LGSWNEN